MEEDRRRIMKILYLFHEKEIREELGIGIIRDAFSDTLFPGTSTLHTRANIFCPDNGVGFSLYDKIEVN